MSRYAAFLRGMNLGGRRITNDEVGAPTMRTARMIERLAAKYF